VTRDDHEADPEEQKLMNEIEFEQKQIQEEGKEEG
jgi:hypothetical protein